MSAPDAKAGLAALLRQRYRAPFHATESRWNPVLQTLLSHRSVRAFLPDPVPDEVVDLAVAAAQSAPSSSNLQAWSVLAVRADSTRKRLKALCGDQRQFDEAPLVLIWLADLSRLRGIGKSEAVGLDYVEGLMLGIVDASLAAQNALIALESQGLGACYIGGMRNHPEEVAALLGLPPEVFAVFGMTVGYPDPARPASVKPRLMPDVVLHAERYRAPDRQRLDAYDESMRAFQAEQSMPVAGWTEVVGRRVGSIGALSNREKLREALLKLGFRLK